MSTIINRLFSKGATTPEVEINAHEQYHSLLAHFYKKGNPSKKLDTLVDFCKNISFQADKELALYELAEHYLTVENYLLNIDAGYISTRKQLREELHNGYPDIATAGPLKILYEEGSSQDLKLGLLFSDFLFKELNKQFSDLRTEAPEFSELRKLDLDATDPLAFISNRRKIREYLNRLIGDYTAYRNESAISIAFASFTSYYKYLKGTKQLDYFLPDQFGKPCKEKQPPSRFTPPPQVPTPLAKSPQVAPSPTLPATVRYKAILENLLDCFLLFEDSGDIIEANSAACKLLNIDKKNTRVHSIFNKLPEEFVKKLQNEIADKEHKIPKTIIGHRQDIELVQAQGEVRYYEVTITNNYTEEVDTYSLLLKNITETKEALTSINAQKENAERAAQAKSTFLSNMSHEIRTPLNVILGLSDILKRSDNKDPDLFIKNVDGIDFSAKNLLSIVNDILDFSKIEAGKLSIQAYDFNVKEVITSLTDGFAIKAQEKGVQVITQIDEHLPDFVVGDQYRLNQILTNLIGNALKFTEEGAIHVLIKEDVSDPMQPKLYFEVKDTGIGISEDKLARIFDSFYQVEGAENSKITGTGLGLAITKELIELQQGTLRATSIPGEGSTFFFRLPHNKSTLQQAEDIVHSKSRSDSDLAGLRVLVAEDNKMNQFYIEQLLSRLEIEVDIAENGKEAVAIYNSKEKGHYDLILMDMHMPIMNGTEAISEIRRSHKDSLKKVPIVACSADVFPEARKEAMKAGIDFYLTKPLSEEALKEVLFWLISDTGEALSITDSGDNTRSNKVDLKKLRETFDGDDDFIATLLDVFIAETPDDYNSLRTCMEREFFPRASKLAHKMKSSFMNLGMTNHGYHLQQIESNVNRTDSVAIAVDHWKEFQKLYTKSLLDVNLLMIELKGN